MRLAEAYIEIRTDMAPMIKGLSRARATLGRAGAKLGRVFARAFGSALRTATRLAKWGALAVGGLVAAMTKLGIDAVESESLFSVSMDKMAESARRWSEELQRDLGLNAFQVREQVAQFNVMLKAMGQSEEAAYDMSKGLVQLAHDLASFWNLAPVEAFDKLRAGIVGEVEPLRRIGVVLSAEAVKAHAFAEGIASGTKELKESEKILARYSLIMKLTTAAQGDLARTSESAANQWRRLKANIISTMTTIGQEQTVPVFTDIVKVLNEWITANDTLIKQKFTDWATTTKKAMATIPVWWDETGRDAFQAITDTIVGFGRVVGHAMRFWGVKGAPQLGVRQTRLREERETLQKQIETNRGAQRADVLGGQIAKTLTWGALGGETTDPFAAGGAGPTFISRIAQRQIDRNIARIKKIDQELGKAWTTPISAVAPGFGPGGWKTRPLPGTPGSGQFQPVWAMGLGATKDPVVKAIQDQTVALTGGIPNLGPTFPSGRGYDP